jgi:heat shock protein HslJ
MKRLLQITLVLIVLALFAGVAGAAPALQEEVEGRVYVVQPGDYLAKLARLFYGDSDAWVRIVEATNAMADTDSSFRVITDPNIILVGEKLWVPGAGELPEASEESADDAAAVETLEPALPPVGSGVGDMTAGANRLAGTNWQLTTLNNQSPIDGTTISLDFASTTEAGGTNGCNRYGTTYEAGRIRMSFGPAFETSMACPPEIMAQAQSYMEALAATTFFSLTADQLRLFDENLTMMAEFAPASSALAGTSWDVINYNNGREAVVSVLADTSITAVFDEDGTISGSAGCNSYFGPYTAEAGAIEIGPLASTRMACAEDGVMEQEAAFLAALETASTYKITGNSMEMRDEGGALVAMFSLVQ